MPHNRRGLQPLRECEMKKFVAVFCLLICATSLVYGQKTRFGHVQVAEKPNPKPKPKPNPKPNPADYPVKIHISATHIRHNCSGNASGFGDTFSGNIHCGDLLYADAILNGKKIELAGDAVVVEKFFGLIIPGDYQAKLTRDNHNSDGTLFSQAYDLLLTDGMVWHCWTSGISG